MRRVSAGLVIAVAAVLIAGCAGFDGHPTTSQVKTIGHVSLHFVVCVGGAGISCSTGPEEADNPTEVLLAALVPTGTAVPATITSVPSPLVVTDLDGNTLSKVTFTRNADYTAAVEVSQTAPAGFEWVGYVSPYIEYDYTGSGLLNFTSSVDLGQLEGSNGKPVSTIFKYQVGIGGLEWKQNGYGGTVPPPATYTCGGPGDGLFGPYYYPADEDADNGTPYFEEECVTTVWPDAPIPTFFDYALKAAWIVPGKTVSAGKGTTAKLSFTFDYVGSKPGKAFTLSASSGKVSIKSIKPSGKTAKKVTVTVHTSTHSGTYKITLTAKYPGGQVRKGTDKLKVG